MPVVLWATTFLCWETDYLLEIFSPDDGFEHLEWDGKSLPPAIVPSRIRALVYNIQNAGKDATYQEVRSLLVSFPSINVLVHLSDEWQGSSKKWRYGEGIELYRLHPQLVLRQYSPFSYEADLQHNMSKVMTLPLGYMRGMLFPYTNRTHLGKKEPPPRIPFHQRRSRVDGSVVVLKTSTDVALYTATIRSSDRRYNWSHVGELGGHGDRQKAMHIFSTWDSHKRGKMHKEEMFELYTQSKFVPVGRGQKNLDCFRLYEAIMAGAVPVIVGDAAEVNSTFDYHGPALASHRKGYSPEIVGLERPPVLYATTWEAALAEAVAMSDDEIDRRRLAQSQWYASRMARLKMHVLEATGASLFQSAAARKI